MDFDLEPEIDNKETPFRRRIGSPCPKCKKHIHKGNKVCCHCGHKLNPIDILNANYYRETQIKFGVKSAIVIVPVSIAVLTLFFWLIS
jgi:ABC-type nickel/cobalt efflux system permease component RcnA